MVAVFDSDPQKIGSKVEEFPVQDLDSLESFIANTQIDLAILAVPASAARSVASRLEAAGIAGILNFAPIAVHSSGSTTVQDVDLAIELQRLAFSVVRNQRPQ